MNIKESVEIIKKCQSEFCRKRSLKFLLILVLKFVVLLSSLVCFLAELLMYIRSPLVAAIFGSKAPTYTSKFSFSFELEHYILG